MKKFSTGILCLLFLNIFACLYSQQIVWTESYPGIWKASVGKPEKYDLLKTAGAIPQTNALKKMGSASFPFFKNKIDIKIVDGKTYLRFPLTIDEQIYGFGLNFKSVQQRGKIFDLHVDHYDKDDNGRTHSPTPFYVSSKGYGVFINSSRYLKVWAGIGVRKDSPEFPTPLDRNTNPAWDASPYSDAVEILVPAAGVEVYIFGGEQPLDAVKRFNLLGGGGCLPPRWGLGFMQRVRTLFSESDIEKEVNMFQEKGYPLDIVGLEPGWQSKSYPGSFIWDQSRFPDPKNFVGNMLNKGIRINLWMNPYVSPYAPFYKDIKPFTSSHTVWLGLIPDFNIKKARGLFFDHLKKNQVDIGVSGYKIDEVDGYDNWLWPDIATFPSGISAEQMRQTYGVLSQRYSYDLFQKKNTRTYGLVRASNAGAVSFPYVIYNDYYDHGNFITALINSSFAGVLWTPEVRSSSTAEEWLRRFQSNVFSPLAMINAWADGTKPWTFPEVENNIKEFALLRMKMMPYWYTEFAKYHYEGTPPFRAMNLEEGFMQNMNTKDAVALKYAKATNGNIKDQYMAGEFLLVAPMFVGQKSRTVVLPKGRWYDFYTGKYVGEGEVITVAPGLSEIPVFVKDGGIIPMMPALLHTPRAGEKVDLEIRYYGVKSSSYNLYDDDGLTFNYQKGEFSWRMIKVEIKNGMPIGSVSHQVEGMPNSYNDIRFTYMTK